MHKPSLVTAAPDPSHHDHPGDTDAVTSCLESLSRVAAAHPDLGRCRGSLHQRGVGRRDESRLDRSIGRHVEGGYVGVVIGIQCGQRDHVERCGVLAIDTRERHRVRILSAAALDKRSREVDAVPNATACPGGARFRETPLEARDSTQNRKSRKAASLLALAAGQKIVIE